MDRKDYDEDDYFDEQDIKRKNNQSFDSRTGMYENDDEYFDDQGIKRKDDWVNNY